MTTTWADTRCRSGDRIEKSEREGREGFREERKDYQVGLKTHKSTIATPLPLRGMLGHHSNTPTPLHINRSVFSKLRRNSRQILGSTGLRGDIETILRILVAQVERIERIDAAF
jgi:hypothetical protein